MTSSKAASNNKTLAKIHIAKKELGLDDDAYRDVLERITGKRSSKGMTSAQHKAVLDEFKRLGWMQKRSTFKPSNKSYVRLIHALWRSCANKGVIDDGSRQALRAFVENQTGVSDPDFLTYPQALPVIEALKKMEARGDG